MDLLHGDPARPRDPLHSRRESPEARDRDPRGCDLLRRCLGAASRERETEEAWRLFVERYGRAIGLLVRRTCEMFGVDLSYDEREDLVQNLYLGFLSRSGMPFVGREDSHLWQFLRRSVRNLVVDEIRRRAAKKRGGRGPWRNASRGTLRTRRSSPGDTEEVLESRLDPEIRALRTEAIESFLGRCMAFGESEGRALVLVLLGGWTSREVSHALADDFGGEMAPRQVDNLVTRFRRGTAGDGPELPRREPGPVDSPRPVPVLVRRSWVGSEC